MTQPETETSPSIIDAQGGPDDASSTSSTSSSNTPASARKSRSKERVGNDGTLTVFSKKSERLRKRQQLRSGKATLESDITILDLPFDILMQILSYLRPSHVFRLSRACRSLHTFLLVDHPDRVARSIVGWRYSCLEKCMRPPVLICDVDDVYRDALQDQGRLRGHEIRRRPYYQHIKPPDPAVVCTCMTCVFRWNVLCLAVDFAHWQDRLDRLNADKEPLPTVPRGREPEWNAKLLDAHAAVVEKAMRPAASGACEAALWHAAILEAHLNSTVRAIRRNIAYEYNTRDRFRMTAEDAASGTDEFLQRKGQPTLDFPYQRDNYYFLEAYLPNRGWLSEEGRWGYMPAEQHDKDLEQLSKWVAWQRSGGGSANGTWVLDFKNSQWKPVLELRGGSGLPRERPTT